jgi:hypothetical protein
MRFPPRRPGDIVSSEWVMNLIVLLIVFMIKINPSPCCGSLPAQSLISSHYDV